MIKKILDQYQDQANNGTIDSDELLRELRADLNRYQTKLLIDLEQTKQKYQQAYDFVSKKRRIDQAKLDGYLAGIDLAIYFIKNNNQ